MIVTTARGCPATLESEAIRLADRLSAAWVPRNNFSIGRLLGEADDGRVLLLTREQWKLYRNDAPPLFFHPSSAMLRIKRLLSGGSDPLLAACGAASGDTVLDCTAGLCSDAIVLAFAVGEQGKVTALESEPVLAALLQEGTRRYKSGNDFVDEAMRRVTIACREHGEMLAALPDCSWDIVYFDPMFHTPITASQAMNQLRGVANHSPLTAAAVRQALRVANKRVVMKELRDSGEFARLGFDKRLCTSSKIAYGVIDL